MLRTVGAVLLSATIAVGCSSMSNGIVAIETRGVVSDTANSFYRQKLPGERGPALDAEDPNGGTFTAGRSLGLRGAINSPIVDLIGEADEVRFDGQNVPEASIGLRKRITIGDWGGPYVEATRRRGFHLDTRSGSRSYDGYELGCGFIIQFSSNWFFDLGFGWQSTLHQLDLDNGNPKLREVVLNFGIGFSL